MSFVSKLKLSYLLFNIVVKPQPKTAKLALFLKYRNRSLTMKPLSTLAETSVSKGWIELLTTASKKVGFDINSLKATVDIELSEDKHLSSDIRIVRYLHDSLAERSNTDAFFIKVAQCVTPLTFGPYSVALHCAPNVNSFIDIACDNMICLSPQFRLKKITTANNTLLSFIDNSVTHSAKVTLHGLFLIAATFLEMLKVANGGRVIPCRIDCINLDMNETGVQEAIMQKYGCELTTNTPEFQLIFPQNILSHPLSLYDEYTFSTNLLATEKLARMLSSTNIISLINNILDEQDNLIGITSQNIASQLSLSTRTLNRRLSEIGTTFQNTFNNYKINKAVQLLNSPRVSVTEVAYYLGYSDVSSFSRSFKRLTGSSPSSLLHK